uniref:Uncharacterized protein n=2 Tax=viral metagenome TaxID=1070528 RepID=A0A6H2A3C8_9ZZZZ
MNKVDLEQLEKVGLTAAAKGVKDLIELKRKMMIAYEHFRYVTQNKIDTFNEKLKKETLTEDKRSYSYKRLDFIKLSDYTEVPPQDVISKLEEALSFNCFDYFEVAKIKDIVEVKDPIVFGRINNCSDRFFIGQWDNDISIEDIIKENEG